MYRANCITSNNNCCTINRRHPQKQLLPNKLSHLSPARTCLVFGIVQHYLLNDAAVPSIRARFPKPHVPFQLPRHHLKRQPSRSQQQPYKLPPSPGCSSVSSARPQLSASKSLFHSSLRASPTLQLPLLLPALQLPLLFPALQLPLLLPARLFPLHRPCSDPKEKMQKMRAYKKATTANAAKRRCY